MAGAASSQLFSVLAGWESTEGTEVAADKDLGLVQSCDMAPTNELIEAAGFGVRNVSQLEFGPYTVGGTITSQWQHGRILDLALGGISHSGATDPFTHTYTEANAVNSFTLEKAVDFTTGDDIVETFTGCKVNSLELSLDHGGVLEWTANILGMSSNTTDVAATAAVVDTLPTFPSQTATVSLGVDASEVAIGQVINMNIRIENNLLPQPQFGARTVGGHSESGRRYSGTITAAFDAATEYPFFMGVAAATTPQTTNITTTTLLVALTRTSATRTLNLEFNSIALERLTASQTLNEIVYQEIAFRAKSIGVVTSKDDIASADWE